MEGFGVRGKAKSLLAYVFSHLVIKVPTDEASIERAFTKIFDQGA